MVSAAFDMWSLGCILCEMATRRTTHSRSVGMPFAANRPAFGQMMQARPAPFLTDVGFLILSVSNSRQRQSVVSQFGQGCYFTASTIAMMFRNHN